MKAYRTMGGLTVPPYYGEHVLPTYASVVGIELVPNQPRSAPIISWNGWHQFLLHKILLEPETTFYHITRLLTALNLQISLNRTDFPLAPDPNALVKEARFRTEIYGLIRMGMRAGAMGGGMGMLGGGMAGASVYGGGNAHISSAAAHAMAQAMNQQASSMFNGSALTGAGFGVNQWFFGGGAGC
ncbi:hypothetical protein K432DRAFT_382110 [Lepidopterella palustris CBS 459.81]|uniref:Uncharacterized protein n=1 Tax=Lepidopterella palustris CBS 459.81 TaxID=1314670 RepID=A0A8E2JFJ9_9PEZI|nr:hypothetical protein K432DRAFT_382110 [Lepidopterella palustris CBS 459.81]